MQDAVNVFDTQMQGLPRQEWLSKLEEMVDENGYFQPLGDHHFAAFTEDKPILLVTFETLQDIQARNDNGQPLGFELVRELGWSNLCLLSDGQTWFRDSNVYGYFDRLVDDGFFDEFEQVIFYGAGACGYAAAAFSVAAPSATVVALHPQATLDPRLTPWENRFPGMRKVSFTNRYGFAPDMLDAAERAFVIYNPALTPDAIHAAMFARPNVTLLRTSLPRPKLEPVLLELQVLYRILVKAAQQKLDERSFGRLMRARRDYLPYLRFLLDQTEKRSTPLLTQVLCKNVATRLNAPRFRRKLVKMENADEERMTG